MAISTGITVLATLTGRAEDATDGFYLNADVGIFHQQEAVIHGTFGTRTSVSYNPGVRTDMILGYRLNKSWSVELETGLLWNTIHEGDGMPLQPPGTTFDTFTFPALTKIAYEIPATKNLKLHLGCGIGGAFSIANIHRGQFIGDADISARDFSLAYELEAGVRLQLAKSVSIGAAYKFLSVSDQEWSFPALSNRLSIDETFTHAVVVGVTWRF